MQVSEIIEVKEQLDKLKKNQIIKGWELPYENLLTRRSAAIFFVNTTADHLDKVKAELGQFEYFGVRSNEEKQLSDLPYRITFNAEELDRKNKTN